MTPEALVLLRDVARERKRIENQIAALDLTAELKELKTAEAELRVQFDGWMSEAMASRNRELAAGKETPMPKIPFQFRIDRRVVIHDVTKIPASCLVPNKPAIKKLQAAGAVPGAGIETSYVAVIK